MKQSLLLASLVCGAWVTQAIAQPNIVYKTQEHYKTHKISALEEPKDAFNVLIIGDWGRGGHLNQKPVAEQLDQAAFQLEPEFIASTGDNFYTNGVASVNDPLWQTSFERIYDGGNLFIDWYPVLGNHDYRGNSQAEIDYSKISRRWNMPARYHSFERTLEDDKTKALFVFIDTSPFDKAYYKSDTYRFSDVVNQDTAAQRVWLEKTLASSDAKWKIVIGHHPLYTTGKRLGKTDDIREAFHHIFEKYKVDAYFAGHEHDLQHQTPANTYTHHFVSGAGSEVRPTGKEVYTKFAESIPGFMSLSLLPEKLLIQVITHEGKAIYKTAIVKP